MYNYIAKVRLFMKIKMDEERSTTISGLFLRVEVQTEVCTSGKIECKGGRDGGCKHIVATM